MTDKDRRKQSTAALVEYLTTRHGGGAVSIRGVRGDTRRPIGPAGLAITSPDWIKPYRRRPTERVGVVPSTIHLSDNRCLLVVDYDKKTQDHSRARADEHLLATLGPPVLVTHSSNPQAENAHYWYVGRQGREYVNTIWTCDDVRYGETRGTNGYVVVWNPGALHERLEDLDGGGACPEPITDEAWEAFTGARANSGVTGAGAGAGAGADASLETILAGYEKLMGEPMTRTKSQYQGKCPLHEECGSTEDSFYIILDKHPSPHGDCRKKKTGDKSHWFRAVKKCVQAETASRFTPLEDDPPDLHWSHHGVVRSWMPDDFRGFGDARGHAPLYHLDANGVWREDAGEFNVAMIAAARTFLLQVYQGQVEAARGDEGTLDKLNKWYARTVANTANQFFMSGVRKTFCQEKGCVLPPETLDADPYLLAHPDGTLTDLRTGEQRPIRPEDYVSKTTAVAPARGATPMFDAYHRAILGDRYDETMPYLMAWDGRMLTRVLGGVDYSLLMIAGAPGSGKSTYVEIRSRILGELAGTQAADVVFKADPHPEWKRSLLGCLFYVEEGDRNHSWPPSLNSLVTGTRTAMRGMRENSVERVPTASWVVTCNKIMRFGPHDGITRRILVLRLDQVIDEDKQDKTLGARIVEQEGPAILHRLIQAGVQGMPPLPECLRLSTRDAIAASSSTARFVTECVKVTGNPEDTVGVSDLHGAYAKWVDEQREHPLGKHNFDTEFLPYIQRLWREGGKVGEEPSKKKVRVGDRKEDRKNWMWIGIKYEGPIPFTPIGD